MSQIVFKNAKLIPILLLVVPTTAIILVYLLAVWLNHVKPFFPFVSHAAAYPPQAALFSTSVEVTAILGVLTSFLRYVTMEQRKSCVEQNTAHKLNSMALWAGCLAFLGLVVLAVNPVGFPTNDKQDYIWYVAVTHNVGAFGALFCFDFYIVIQAYLSYQQNKVYSYRRNASLHRLLTIPILASSMIIVAVFYYVIEDFTSKLADEERGSYALPNLQYTFFPLMTAILEWIFAFCVFFFLATFTMDFKNTKVVLQLQPKNVASNKLTIASEDSATSNGHDVQNGLLDVPSRKEKKNQ